MKKFFSMMLCAVTILLLSSQVCSADFFRHRYGLGLRMSYLDALNDTDKDMFYDFKSDLVYEANLTYYFSYRFSIEFSAGKSVVDIEATQTGGTVFDYGEVEQTPLLLTFRYHFLTDGMTSPYIGVGIGHYYNELDLSDIGLQRLGATTVASLENGYGLHIAGGLEYFITSNAALNLDAKYVWNRTDLNMTRPGQQEVKYDLDLERFFLGIGIKYYF